MDESMLTNLVLKSPAFPHQGRIPDSYTCKGANISPPLEIQNVPDGTKSLVLIVDDADASVGDHFAHWIVYGISPGATRIMQGSVPEGAKCGKNDFGNCNYGGPCPQSGTHRYFFTLYALDVAPDLDEGLSREAVLNQIQGCILDETTLLGYFG